MAALPESLQPGQRSGAWNCQVSGWRADQPVAWLRFEAASWTADAAPRFFYSRTARHERITLTAVDADGTIRSRSYAEAEDHRGYPHGDCAD